MIARRKKGFLRLCRLLRAIEADLDDIASVLELNLGVLKELLRDEGHIRRLKAERKTAIAALKTNRSTKSAAQRPPALGGRTVVPRHNLHRQERRLPEEQGRADQQDLALCRPFLRPGHGGGHWGGCESPCGSDRRTGGDRRQSIDPQG